MSGSAIRMIDWFDRHHEHAERRIRQRDPLVVELHHGVVCVFHRILT